MRSKWHSLSWSDVANWAGPRYVARGRAYELGRRVRDLDISAEGRLLATVAGGRRYATEVWWEADALRSRCACPVGGNGCKHPVAVVAAYLDMLAKNTAIPIVDGVDARWAELTNDSPEASDEADDREDSEESGEREGQPISRRQRQSGSADHRSTKGTSPGDCKTWLKGFLGKFGNVILDEQIFPPGQPGNAQ